MLNIILDSTNTINIDSLYDVLAEIIINNEGEENECSISEM